MSDLIKHAGLTFSVRPGDEPRIRDVDLAARLEYSRPRKIRELIERELESGVISQTDVRPTVGRTSAKGGRPAVIAFWLNEFAALYIASRSDTKRGRELHAAMVRVFIEVRRQVEAAAAATDHERRLLRLLAHEPKLWEELWPADLVAMICKVYRIHYDGVHFPVGMFAVVEQVYQVILPAKLYEAMRERNPRPVLEDGSTTDRRHKHHQFFEDELRRTMAEQMDVLRWAADQSSNKVEFMARLRRHYRGAMFQTTFQ